MTNPTEPGGGGLRAAAQATPCPDPDRLVAAHDDLRSSMAHLRAALGEFDRAEHDAWTDYARTVDRAIVHLEAELEVSGAQLAVLQATTSDDLAATVHRARTSVSAITDEARVQAHLADLEVRDRVEEASSALHRTVERVGSQAAHDLEAVRTEAVKALDGVRHALGGLLGGRRGPTEG
jgi:hypothetical protein